MVCRVLAGERPAESGFREVKAAHQLDPLSVAINTDIGFHHYYSGRYGEAVTQLQSVLAMKSDFMLAHLWLARALLEQGHFDAAPAETAVAEAKAREWSVLVAARGFTYGMAGMTLEAQAVLREMDALSRSSASSRPTVSHWCMPDSAKSTRRSAGSTAHSTSARTGCSGYVSIRDGRACTVILGSPRRYRG